MQTIMDLLEVVNGVIWHNFVLYVVLAVGILFTIWSGFSQFRALTHGTQVIRGKYDDPSDPGAINHFQALSAALSATVGLGNIAGVGVAVALGGPGAVFWMWMVGIFGMAIKTTEVTLSMLFRNTDDPDNPHGGPMFVAHKGFKKMGLAGIGKIVGTIFVVTLLISTITGGNMFQAWSVGEITENYFQVPSIVAGIVLAVLVGAVIIGGIKRIGAVAGRIVPLMCAIYLIAAIIVLVLNIGAIPEMLVLIVTEAFNPSEAEGAFLGGTAGYALLWGMKRALFSSEAGQGSSPIAHSAAKTDEPVREGVVAGLEPFIDTIVVCTMTALVIMTTGAFNRGPEAEFPQGTSVLVNVASDPTGVLPAAPAVTPGSEEGSWQLASVAAPTRVPTKADEVAGESPAWADGDKVFLLASNIDESSTRQRSIAGKIDTSSGSPMIVFDPLTTEGTGAPVVGPEVYHGGTAHWALDAPPLPNRSQEARDTSGPWSGGEDVFMLVRADFNSDTGLDFNKVYGRVKLGTDNQPFAEWTSAEEDQLFESTNEPILVGDGKGIFVDYPGPSLTGHAFDREIPGLGKWLVTLAAWLFALSTMISWSYYGEQGVVYLFGDKAVFPYKILYCLMIVVAASGFIRTDAQLDALTALGTGVMLWANIPIMLIFGATAMGAYKVYIGKLKAGEFKAEMHKAPPITEVVEGKDVEPKD